MVLPMTVRYKEMARQLGVSERTLKDMVKRRVIPYIKIRRLVLFDPVKVEAALAKYERQPAGKL